MSQIWSFCEFFSSFKQTQHEMRVKWNLDGLKIPTFQLCTLKNLFFGYRLFRCFVVSLCGCLSIHTEQRGAHSTVYTSQCLLITLIKFHTTQGDSLCLDQIANISWLKYMFAERPEQKRKKKSTQAQKIHKLMAERKDSEDKLGTSENSNTLSATVCCNQNTLTLNLTQMLNRDFFSTFFSP